MDITVKVVVTLAPEIMALVKDLFAGGVRDSWIGKPEAPIPAKFLRRRAADVVPPPSPPETSVSPTTVEAVAREQPAETPSPAAEPAPLPATSVKAEVEKSKFEKTWTEARDECLMRARKADTSWVDILEAVNKLAGPVVKSEAACQTRFYFLRADGYKLPADPPPAAAPAKKSKAAALEPQQVTYAYARQWASERGLVSGTEALDLVKVNAKRNELGLAALIVPKGRAAAK